MIQLINGMPALLFVVLLWVLYFIDLLIPGFSFVGLGIFPRRLDGLYGLVTSPFIHANLGHLISNTIPLLLLPAIAKLAVSRRAVYSIMILGGLGSGLGTWLFSTGGVVIGASGIVFAWLGFLCARAYFAPSLLNIGLSIAVFMLYGGAVAALLKALPTISWAAHFWGFVTGVLIARHFDTFRVRS